MLTSLSSKIQMSQLFRTSEIEVSYETLVFIQKRWRSLEEIRNGGKPTFFRIFFSCQIEFYIQNEQFFHEVSTIFLYV